LNQSYSIKVAVVILNWNGKKFLEKFLPSVVKYSHGAEVIIADNQSSDDSVDFLKTHYPHLRLIQNPKNNGYAGGYNEALSQIDAEYFILLNSDIEVTDNWVMPIINRMDEDPTIGSAQPKLRSYFQQEEFEYAGAMGGYIDKYGYPFCAGRIFANLEVDRGQYDQEREVFWASGAAMFLRSSAFREVGGLDNDFFAHMEEIDFCWRLKLAGYKVMAYPQSTVFHVGGGTLPKNSSRKTYLNFRNNFSLLFKNLPAHRLTKVFIARLFLDGVAGLRFLTEGHYQDTWAVIRAHIYFYTHIHQLLRKRKNRKLIPVSNIYQKNIVFKHFLSKLDQFSQLDESDFSK